jgi:hypothetical protein
MALRLGGLLAAALGLEHMLDLLAEGQELPVKPLCDRLPELGN